MFCYLCDIKMILLIKLKLYDYGDKGIYFSWRDI